MAAATADRENVLANKTPTASPIPRRPALGDAAFRAAQKLNLSPLPLPLGKLSPLPNQVNKPVFAPKSPVPAPDPSACGQESLQPPVQVEAKRHGHFTALLNLQAELDLLAEDGMNLLGPSQPGKAVSNTDADVCVELVAKMRLEPIGENVEVVRPVAQHLARPKGEKSERWVDVGDGVQVLKEQRPLKPYTPSPKKTIKPFSKRKVTSKKPQAPPKCKKFSYNSLYAATNGFSGFKENVLGEGGQAKVYRGKMFFKSRWVPVAIKRFFSKEELHEMNKKYEQENPPYGQPNGQQQLPNANPGDPANAQQPEEEEDLDDTNEAFLGELEVLRSLEPHTNIVSLIGYCEDPPCLVYEYLAGGNLEDHLYDARKTGRKFDWQRRLECAEQVCRGVQTLHHLDPPILHSDIKPTNVLLDDDGTCKLADFGMAAWMPIDGCIGGTDGYMDPDWTEKGNDVTLGADVFALGILLKHLLTGMTDLYYDGHVLESNNPMVVLQAAALDMNACWPHAVARKVTNLAVRCTDWEPANRPTIDELLEEIEDARKMGTRA